MSGNSAERGARRVLMIAAYKARDLEGHALIGFHLERLGHAVTYTNGYGIERKLREIGPDVLVMDHMAWSHKVEQARLARSLGMKVVIVPTEGLFPHAADVVEAAGGLFTGASELIDLHLSWGPFHQRALAEAGFLQPEAAPVTGCQRFDLYAPRFAALKGPRESFGAALGLRHPERPMILWCTNTPWVGRNRDVMIERHVGKARWTHQRALENWEDENTQYREHGALVQRLAQMHPEWNFVIKIHPGEGVASYVGMAEAQENIVLGYDAPIREFLMHCDVVLQRNCTTATEAWMLGKPALQLEIGDFHRDGSEMLRPGNQVVRSIAETEEHILGILAGADIPADISAARSDFIREYYHLIDGGAAARIARHIHAEITGDTYTDAEAAATRNRATASLEAWKAAEDARWPNRIKDLLGVQRSRSLRPWRRLRRTAGDTTLGRFAPEAEITPEMVAPLYAAYEALGLEAPLPAMEGGTS